MNKKKEIIEEQKLASLSGLDLGVPITILIALLGLVIYVAKKFVQ